MIRENSKQFVDSDGKENHEAVQSIQKLCNDYCLIIIVIIIIMKGGGDGNSNNYYIYYERLIVMGPDGY